MNSELVRYGLATIFLVALELLYFRIAERYKIIDRPNERSSHAIPTIRGGGVIFLFAALFWFVISDFQYPWFILSICLISIVSFMDDLGEQPARLRLAVQIISFVLMGWQAGLDVQPLWISFIMLIIGVGTLNAFNFMDGINGITAVYSLVNLFTFFMINEKIAPFVEKDFILTMMLGVVIFLFFNFRKKARCFAGDVGSITIAFVQLFLLVKLILLTHNYGWIFLFLIYGVDSVVTIVYRLVRKENIFKAHRSHLFQYFSNELNVSHLRISLLYGMLQAGINLLLSMFLLNAAVWFSIVMAVGVGIAYVVVREMVLKRIGMKGLIG